MKKFLWLMLIGSILLIAGYIVSANAESLHWTGGTAWVNPDNTAQTGTFTAAEMGTMTFYVRINKSNPQDATGRSDFNQPGTWYYVGETRNGGVSWLADNAIANLFQGYGWAGQPVSFTVSQAFEGSDGVERDSDLSLVYAWTVPVPFVPKRPATAPAGVGIR